MTTEQLFRDITEKPGLEGVTFTGGEPFAQAGPLAELGRRCRQVGLSVVVYSGYEYRRILRCKRLDWKALLRVTDLLLAGPFIKDLADSSRPWIGSSNQEFVFLSDRYRYLQKQLDKVSNRLEMRVQEDGTVSLNGTTPEADILSLRNDLTQLGLKLTGERKKKHV